MKPNTSQYGAQRDAYEEIDRLLKMCQKEQRIILLKPLLYDLTLKYPVSHKGLMKRIELFCDLNGHKIMDDSIDFGAP